MQSERELYATDDNNRFAFGGEIVSQYYDYLVVILGRYEAASQALNANFETFNASIRESLKEAKTGKLSAKEMPSSQRATGSVGWHIWRSKRSICSRKSS